jgi:cytochrome c oxidase subunit 2
MGAQLFVHTPEEYQSWVKEQQAVASNDTLDKAVALNSVNRSSSEILAPYAADMGIESKTLEQLHSSPEHMAHHLVVSQ